MIHHVITVYISNSHLALRLEAIAIIALKLEAIATTMYVQLFHS